MRLGWLLSRLSSWLRWEEGPDRDVRIVNADHIEHERHGENRTAASDQAEREADQHA